jgi:hypothetical protein
MFVGVGPGEKLKWVLGGPASSEGTCSLGSDEECEQRANASDGVSEWCEATGRGERLDGPRRGECAGMSSGPVAVS